MKKFLANPKQVVLILVVVIAFFLVLDYNNRATALHRVNTQLQIIQTDVHQLHQTEIVLNQQIAFATSIGGVEEYAREAGYKQPGDVVVVPISTMAATLTPTPYATPTPVEIKNWEIWWAVFFGE